MITTILLLMLGAVYLGANGLTYGGQCRDSFAKICADSNRDRFVQAVAGLFVVAIVAANVYL